MYLTIKQLSQNVKDNAIFKIILYNKIGDKMRIEYFINEMLQKLDWATINTYFIKEKRKKKK